MKLIQTLKAREDNLLAAGLAWTVVMFWSVSFGFYFGCICGRNHAFDLDQETMQTSGLQGAGIGLLVGIAIACFFTFIYPKWTAEDAREELEADAHH